MVGCFLFFHIMKYFICISCFIVFFCTIAASQKNNLYLSFNNGINYSGRKIVNDPTNKNNDIYRKLTYRYGLGIKYNIFKTFRVGLACNIEQKGWKTTHESGIDTIQHINYGNIGLNFAYYFISFPIVVDYSIQVKRVKFFIEGGYLINMRRRPAIIKSNRQGLATNITYSQGAKSDFGWQYGSGMEVNIYKNVSLSLVGLYAQTYTGIGTTYLEQYYLRHDNYAGLLQVLYKIK